jgi:N-acetylglucosaminyldiphosphoundecaprenol N-acetyl-beta-D-mannosaminyltransferase
MKQQKILGITIEKHSNKEILEKIKKYLLQPRDFFHIVSINPENLVIAQTNEKFKEVVEMAQIKVIDGFGVALAGKILGVDVGKRLAGVDLVERLIEIASDQCLRVLLLGGRQNLALRLAECYQAKFPQAKFFGLEGIKEIKNCQKEDEEKIISIVTEFKPHIILVAFGSPEQELWLTRHKDLFKGVVCMGVGGSFDFLGGIVPRASRWIRSVGMEWLFRLVNQPWRCRRQTRLIRFLWLVLVQKITSR